MERFRGVIPEGTQQTRIRCSRRDTRDPTSVGQGTLADTLGEEATGLVMIDPSGVGVAHQLSSFVSVFSKMQHGFPQMQPAFPEIQHSLWACG